VVETDTYESDDVLQHIARPSDPLDRQDATHVWIEDYTALEARYILLDRAYYRYDGEKADVARGYAEYINMCVRDEEHRNVTLFYHTDLAKQVLQELDDVVDCGFVL